MFTSRVISDKGLEELQYYKYHSSVSGVQPGQAAGRLWERLFF